jgi:phosphoribosylaminoimidazole-succinocarboxamide synthase
MSDDQQQFDGDGTVKLIKKGKVRDLYDIGENRILVYHSDRVSSFDKIWCDIKGKGSILNCTSAWWFERTKHIIRNHLVHSWDGGRYMVVKKCTVFPIEFVVRGYITGSTQTSLWTHYLNGEREYCGVKFPDGLQKNQKLDQPVITPTTKGDSDIPVSPSDIISSKYMTYDDWNYCSSKALELFEFGQKVSKQAGLILVDTKYEFGKDIDTGEILLIDEIHTCDSSRYWKSETYQNKFQSGLDPDRYDKDLIRTYVKSQCDPYKTNPKDITIPQSVKDTVSEAYNKFYLTLTGEIFFQNKLLNTQDVEYVYSRYQYLQEIGYIIDNRNNRNNRNKSDN